MNVSGSASDLSTQQLTPPRNPSHGSEQRIWKGGGRERLLSSSEADYTGLSRFSHRTPEPGAAPDNCRDAAAAAVAVAVENDADTNGTAAPPHVPTTLGLHPVTPRTASGGAETRETGDSGPCPSSHGSTHTIVHVDVQSVGCAPLHAALLAAPMFFRGQVCSQQQYHVEYTAGQ